MGIKGRDMTGLSKILWHKSEFLCLYYMVRIDGWK